MSMNTILTIPIANPFALSAKLSENAPLHPSQIPPAPFAKGGVKAIPPFLQV
jgi:hypothetical protein